MRDFLRFLSPIIFMLVGSVVGGFICELVAVAAGWWVIPTFIVLVSILGMGTIWLLEWSNA